MMNIVNAAFLQSSSAIYFSRFINFVEEMLVAPLSYVEMIVGQPGGGGAALHRHRHRHPADGHGFRRHPYRILAAVPVLDRERSRPCSACSGIIIGLWSKSFEQLNMPVVFFLTPLSMVGGVFNTIEMLPAWLHWLAWANPFFYFINGIRGAMIGFDEAPPGLGIGLTLLLLVVLGVTVWRLYAKGYGLRE